MQISQPKLEYIALVEPNKMCKNKGNIHFQETFLPGVSMPEV